jgi:uncharacterized small protein (DUF1192 family)
MFEREIRFITDITLNNIKRLGTFFTLESLEKAKVHPAIVQYISAELDYLIYLDRQRLLQKSLFDYSGAEINKHFFAISAEIKKNKLIPFEEIRRLVQQAVNFNVHYLLRPHWTLKKYIYDNEEYRSAEELQLFLNYTYFYDYYKQYILTYVERRQLLSLSANEFSERITLLSKELQRTQLEVLIESNLVVIAEFLNMGEANKTRLSVGVIETFLKDKELNDQILRIRQLLSDDQKQKFSIEEFKFAIMSNISVTKTVEFAEAAEDVQSTLATAPKSELPEDEPQTAPPVEEKKELAQVEIDALFDEAEEHANTFAARQAEQIVKEVVLPPDEPAEEVEDKQEETEENIPDEPENPTIVIGTDILLEEIRIANEELKPAESESAEDPEVLEEPEEEIVESLAINTEALNESDESVEQNEVPAEPVPEAEVSEPVPETPAEEPEAPATLEESDDEVELFTYFTTKETMRIIAVVFGNDSVDFVNTIEKIADCPDFEQAALILQSVFSSYHINPLQSREGRFLEERVKQYFAEKRD